MKLTSGNCYIIYIMLNRWWVNDKARSPERALTCWFSYAMPYRAEAFLPDTKAYT